jgi:SAM-dependent methyltransferase
MNAQQWLLRYMEYSFKQTVKQVYSSPSRLMAPNARAVLVDCGCHNGDYSRNLAETLGADRVFGVELNSELAHVASANGVKVLRADVNQSIPLRSNSVDVLTAFNVLEHLVETQQFIREIYRVVAPNGYAIINTPNLASWHNIAALFMGMQPFSGPNIDSMTESDVPIVRQMHRRAHQLPEDVEFLSSAEPERHRHIVVVAFRSLIKALERAGFTIEAALGYGYYPLPPLLAWAASRIDPWHAHHMVIKARKIAPDARDERSRAMAAMEPRQDQLTLAQ